MWTAAALGCAMSILMYILLGGTGTPAVYVDFCGPQAPSPAQHDLAPATCKRAITLKQLDTRCSLNYRPHNHLLSRTPQPRLAEDWVRDRLRCRVAWARMFVQSTAPQERNS